MYKIWYDGFDVLVLQDGDEKDQTMVLLTSRTFPNKESVRAFLLSRKDDSPKFLSEAIGEWLRATEQAVQFKKGYCKFIFD